MEVYNENFYTDMSAYYMEYAVLADGEEVSRGQIKLPKIAAQSRVKVTSSDLAKALKKAPAGKEILVDVEFKLKEAAPLLEKDFVVAHNQFEVAGYEFPQMAAANTGDVKIDEAVAYVKLEAAGVVYTFNKNYYVYARRGDTFRSIAAEMDISYRKLARYNERDKNDVIEAGEIIWLMKKARKLPKSEKGRLHYVKAGESMYTIAQKYGIRVKYLYKLNHLEPYYQARVGDALKLR